MKPESKDSTQLDFAKTVRETIARTGGERVATVQPVTRRPLSDRRPIDHVYNASKLYAVALASWNFLYLWDKAGVLGIASQTGAGVVELLAAVNDLDRVLTELLDGVEEQPPVVSGPTAPTT